jgi:hypothetical protein
MWSANSPSFSRSLSSSKRGLLLRLVTSMSAMVGERISGERKKKKKKKRRRKRPLGTRIN